MCLIPPVHNQSKGQAGGKGGEAGRGQRWEGLGGGGGWWGKELTCTTKTYAAYSLMSPEVKRASCTSSPSPESAPFMSASSRSRLGARTVT